VSSSETPAPVAAEAATTAATDVSGNGKTFVSPVAQVLVVGYVLLFRYAGDAFAWLLPTPTTIEVANALGLQALDTIQRYTAPAPLNEGVTFWLLVVVAAVAICVDAMAATWRSPVRAAAGRDATRA